MRILRSVLLAFAVIAWAYFAFKPPAVISAGPPELESPANVVAVHSDIIHAGDELAIPTDLAVVGGRLVVVDRYADQPIHILNPKSGTLVRSLGREGDGPGEYRQLTSISPDPASKEAFWAYDMGLGRLTYVDLEDEESLRRPWEALLLTLQSDAPVIGIEWTDRNELVAAGFFPEGRLGLFASDGEMLGSFGSLPDNPDGVAPSVLQHAYMGTLKQQPDGSRLAIGLLHASSVEIRDSSGSLIVRARGPQAQFTPSFETQETERGPLFKGSEELRFGYIDVTVTSDRIYGLFSGRTRAGNPGKATFGNYVHVFDWDGTLIEVLKVDRDLIAIAVDERRGTLYGVSHDPAPAVVAVPLMTDSRLASR